MAITDNFSLSRALNSQSYAYKCWYNVTYGGNTMNIPSEAMGQISHAWRDEIPNWQKNATNDENAYEIEDDDFESAKENGMQNAKDKTGYEGGKNNTGTIVTAGASIAGAGCGAVSLVATGGASVASGGGGFICGVVGAGIVIANAARYYIGGKPNQEAKEACDVMVPELGNAQAALTTAQDDMEIFGDEIVELSDEANQYNDEANENIEEDKTLFDMYKASYEELTMKLQSGQTLTEDEKILLQQLVPLMQELGVSIEDTTDETTELVGETYEEMETYQEGYDTVAETVAEVQGATDFAASFDEATKTACNTEGVAHTINATAGAAIGLKLILSATPLSFWKYVLGGATILAGASSAKSAYEQYEWKDKVETEIDIRKETQDFNSETSDIYDENIEIYDGQMENIEEMEIQVPDDLEAPEEVPVIPMDNSGTGSNPFDPTASGQGTGINGGPTTLGSTNNEGSAPNEKEDEEKDKPVV